MHSIRYSTLRHDNTIQKRTLPELGAANGSPGFQYLSSNNTPSSMKTKANHDDSITPYMLNNTNHHILHLKSNVPKDIIIFGQKPQLLFVLGDLAGSHCLTMCFKAFATKFA